MYAEIKFQRNMTDEDFVSPGGYEAVMKDGRRFAFDFTEYEGGSDRKDASILQYCQKDPDISAFPDIENFSYRDFAENFDHFEEFYLDTEGCGPDLYPVELVSLEIDFNEPDKICKWVASRDVLDAVTEKFHECFSFHEELEKDGYEAE